MIEIFNAAQQPATEAAWGALALLPLGWFLWRRWSGRPAPIWVPILATLFVALTTGTSLWDHWRIREMLRTGEGLQTTKGTITQSWVIESRNRDWSKKSLSYRTAISEGFDIGDQRFSWNRRDSLSGASFTNGGDPPIRFVEGAIAEVTWFADPASDNQRRIIRLAVSKAPAPDKAIPQAAAAMTQAAPLKTDTADFAVFWLGFSHAAAQRDEETVRALTELPFSFNGIAVEDTRFAQVFSGAFIAFIHDCLAKTQAREAADKSRSASCGSTTFVFRKNKAGYWRFAALRRAAGR